MSSSDLPDSIARNVRSWTKANKEHTDSAARRHWAADDITWGVFSAPESELNALPAELAGLDVVELGCGTAYFSAWLAKRGARPVGVDPTPAQLATAHRMQAETGIEFPLHEAPGEQVPLPDASFDLVVSEYGASLWAVPERWVAEAARLLRPAGQLVFLTNSVLLYLCSPDVGRAVDRLVRPQFGMYSITWPDDEWEGVEYHLSHGDWIKLLRANGFDVEGLIEVQAPPDATVPQYYDYVDPEWAWRWPVEDIFQARKRG
jgi:SAM-dependent methyltransferase